MTAATKTPRKPAAAPAPVPVPRETEPALALTPAGFPADLGDPTPGPAPLVLVVNLSKHQVAAMRALGNATGTELVRSDLKADPMVIVAIAQRGWATVDRQGKDRQADLVTLTPLGRLVASALGVVGL